MASTDLLTRAETQLGHLTRGREQATLRRWRTASADLAAAGTDLSQPVHLAAWLRRRPTREADEILRGLVTLTQRGDTVALLAVLVCLAPGIRSLARRTGTTVDEVLSEVTLGILEYPVARRRVVAAGVLLDARNRITRRARRAPHPVEDVTAYVDHHPHTTPGPASGGERTTAERILQLICEARQRRVLSHDDAQLIVDTRLRGEPVAPVAARLGITPAAAYQRRTRAETRLATTLP